MELGVDVAFGVEVDTGVEVGLKVSGTDDCDPEPDAEPDVEPDAVELEPVVELRPVPKGLPEGRVEGTWGVGIDPMGFVSEPENRGVEVPLVPFRKAGLLGLGMLSGIDGSAPEGNSGGRPVDEVLDPVPLKRPAMPEPIPFARSPRGLGAEVVEGVAEADALSGTLTGMVYVPETPDETDIDERGVEVVVLESFSPSKSKRSFGVVVEVEEALEVVLESELSNQLSQSCDVVEEDELPVTEAVERGVEVVDVTLGLTIC